MEILEEILKRMKELNSYIIQLYDQNLLYSPIKATGYRPRRLERVVSQAKKSYNSFKDRIEDYKPFYSRNNFMFSAIEKADKIMLELYGVISGKYDGNYCDNCSWKERISTIKNLYSKLKKKNVMGKTFYKKELEELVEILENNEVPKRYKKRIRKICRKIRRKNKIRKGGKDEKRQKKHTDS